MKTLYKNQKGFTRTPSSKVSGFTLIEIIVVLAVLIVIISFGMTIDLNVFKGDTFLSEQSKIVSVLEKARSRAMANMFDKAHGVCYLASDYVIFRDGDCDKSSTDETIPASINIAENIGTTFPSSPIVFDQLTGNSTDATIHITDSIKGADIKINNEGAINW